MDGGVLIDNKYTEEKGGFKVKYSKMTYTKEQTDFLRAVSDYYEFPFAVFFMSLDGFKEQCKGEDGTRLGHLLEVLDSYTQIEDIILKQRDNTKNDGYD